MAQTFWFFMKVSKRARVLLMNNENCILLFQINLPSDPTYHGKWYTVGGGVESNETFHQTAQRELLEETGLNVTVNPDPIYTDSRTTTWKGEEIRLEQQYFLARCQVDSIDKSRWTEQDVKEIGGLRWWSFEEVQESTDVIPENLADLIKIVIEK